MRELGSCFVRDPGRPSPLLTSDSLQMGNKCTANRHKLAVLAESYEYRPGVLGETGRHGTFIEYSQRDQTQNTATGSETSEKSVEKRAEPNQNQILPECRPRSPPKPPPVLPKPRLSLLQAQQHTSEDASEVETDMSELCSLPTLLDSSRSSSKTRSDVSSLPVSAFGLGHSEFSPSAGPARRPSRRRSPN